MFQQKLVSLFYIAEGYYSVQLQPVHFVYICHTKQTQKKPLPWNSNGHAVKLCRCRWGSPGGGAGEQTDQDKGPRTASESGIVSGERGDWAYPLQTCQGPHSTI